MSRYKIEVTTTSAAGPDFEWLKKLKLLNGTQVVVKRFTEDLIDLTLTHENRIIMNMTFASTDLRRFFRSEGG